MPAKIRYVGCTLDMSEPIPEVVFAKIVRSTPEEAVTQLESEDRPFPFRGTMAFECVELAQEPWHEGMAVPIHVEPDQIEADMDLFCLFPAYACLYSLNEIRTAIMRGAHTDGQQLAALFEEL